MAVSILKKKRGPRVLGEEAAYPLLGGGGPENFCERGKISDSGKKKGEKLPVTDNPQGGGGDSSKRSVQCRIEREKTPATEGRKKKTNTYVIV